MPNLMLTTACNFACRYCFGLDILGPGEPVTEMSSETFDGLCDWMLRSAHPPPIVHLMGGEPTLNRRFPEYALQLKDLGFDVAVFSNAATRRAAEYADRLHDQRIRWIVNVNPPSTRSPGQDANLRQTLPRLGDRATLTFNMTAEDVANDWVFDLIFDHGLSRKVKVGFVLPTLSHNNEHLAASDYPRVAARVREFARTCARYDVKIEFECGIPWCSFSAEDMGVLWSCGSTFFSACDSILDITPEGQVIYCLPLARYHAVHYTRFADYPAAKAHFEGKLNSFRIMGTKKECHLCLLMKAGLCCGGCMARVLSGVRSGAGGAVGR